ncbi:MAG: type II toxin-antitoxin system HicB family antitoxin [Candidatus Vogelbacteria bacterium]|nr:type II toxin-antitoxin system HicB family antitoxin [Candidatus Vogelbacteria bacterium]
MKLVKNVTNYRYNIMLRPAPEGGFTVMVPALPGCISYGKTIEKAKEMAQDAIYGYIVSLKKHNEPIPSDDNVYLTTLDLKYAPTA